ncbi:MAG: response regulator, partial [Chloroflexota bacterium]
QDEGFGVTMCGNAEQAFEHLSVSLPDVLLLDGRLPGMSGWLFLEMLRASERTATLPILMLTAAPHDVDRYRRDESDACTSYLVKPFDIDTLLDAIQTMIAHCRPQLVAG